MVSALPVSRPVRTPRKTRRTAAMVQESVPAIPPRRLRTPRKTRRTAVAEASPETLKQVLWKAEQDVIAVAAVTEVLDAEVLATGREERSRRAAEENQRCLSHLRCGLNTEEVIEEPPKKKKQRRVEDRGAAYRRKVANPNGRRRGGPDDGSCESRARRQRRRKVNGPDDYFLSLTPAEYEMHLIKIFKSYADLDLQEAINAIEMDSDLYVSQHPHLFPPIKKGPGTFKVTALPNIEIQPMNTNIDLCTVDMSSIGIGSSLFETLDLEGVTVKVEAPEQVEFKIEPGEEVVIKIESDDDPHTKVKVEVKDEVKVEEEDDDLECYDLAELCLNPFEHLEDSFLKQLERYLFCFEKIPDEETWIHGRGHRRTADERSLHDCQVVLHDHNYAGWNFGLWA